MKKLLIILFLLLSTSLISQTCVRTVVYDYIETYTWGPLGGLWNGSATSGYFTNAFVSSNASAVQYGTGNGGSGIEQDTYVLPNITGLNAAYTYKVKFRLGAYRFTGGATQGVDNPDYIEMRLSTNGTVSYTNEIRITGSNNAYWNYNTLGVINKVANGVLSTYTPAAAGGDRTATGDGYSDITLELPAGTTQCAVNLYCRANSSGEEWWIDNIELLEYYPCALPIELILFTGEQHNEFNILRWITATEHNNNYFTVERSFDAINFEEVGKVTAAGNSSYNLSYSLTDERPFDGVTYYRLTQTDFDGKHETFKLISVTRLSQGNLRLIKITNLLGQEVNENCAGILIYYFSDGSAIKTYRTQK